MAPTFKSRISLLTVLIAGCCLFYVLERMIGDLPNRYESAQAAGSPPGLDPASWDKVQLHVEQARGLLQAKIEDVAQLVAGAQARQGELVSRLDKLKGERSMIEDHQKELLKKLTALELERKQAYGAAEFCEKNLKSCATPADVESQCVAATKDLSLVAKLEDEKGPLRQAVSDLVMDAMAKDKGCTTKGYIDEKWADALRRSAQDDVGMRDYALQDTGADVVMGGGGKNILGGGKKALTSPTFTPKGARWTTDQACRLGLQQCKDVGGPLEAINRDKEKGRCFAFGGAEGSLTVKLPEPITPFAFTLEHLNKVYSEQGGDSAPRAFKVYGYEDAAALGAAAAALQQQQDAQGNSTVASGGEQGAEQQQQQQQQRELGVEAEESSFEDPGILLLEATYDIHAGNPVQTWYSLRPGAKKHPVRYVRLQVDSNYGNPDYTCVYRFRAHSTQ